MFYLGHACNDASALYIVTKREQKLMCPMDTILNTSYSYHILHLRQHLVYNSVNCLRMSWRMLKWWGEKCEYIAMVHAHSSHLWDKFSFIQMYHLTLAGNSKQHCGKKDHPVVQYLQTQSFKVRCFVLCLLHLNYTNISPKKPHADREGIINWPHQHGNLVGR